MEIIIIEHEFNGKFITYNVCKEYREETRIISKTP